MLVSIYILCFLCLLGSSNGTVFDIWPNNFYMDVSAPTGVFFVCAAVLQGTVLDVLFEYFKIPIPGYAITTIIGILWGVGARYNEVIESYVEIVLTNYISSTMRFGLLFHVALSLDCYALARCWKQVTIICFAELLTIFVFAVPVTIVLDGVSYADSVMFACLVSITYPTETVEMFKETKYVTKNLYILLQAECLLGTPLAEAIFSSTSYYLSDKTSIQFVLVRTVLRLTGAVFSGYVLGKICCFTIKYVSISPELVVLTSGVFTLLSGYILMEYTFLPGIIILTAICIQISKLRVSLQSDADCYLLVFYKFYESICKSNTAIACGIYLGFIIIPETTVYDALYVFVTYVSIYAVRLISFSIFYILLAKVDNGMNAKIMALAAWSAPRSIVSFNMIFQRFDITSENVIMKGHFFYFHVVLTTIASLLINIPVTKLIVKMSRLSEISLTSQLNMTGCIKHIMTMRENTIAVLKMDRLLSDANWPVVLRETHIQHPYKVKIVVADTKNELFSEARPIICPDCLTAIPEQPTNMEFSQMIREARYRILKILKICYRKQYICGKICRETALKLDAAVEIAAESGGEYWVIDILAKQYNIKDGSIGTLRTLFNMCFDPIHVNIKPPNLYWRRVCYNVVTSIFYEAVMSMVVYTYIVPNVIQLSREVRFGSKMYSTVKRWAIAANIIQFIDFLLSISAFWVYIFKHPWLSIQFAVFVACLAETLLIIFYPYWYRPQIKSGLMLQVIFLLLKVLLLLRILRLLRVLLIFRRAVNYLRNLLYDREIATAYELGKAFVYGQDQLLEMIDFVIDNSDIRDDARNRIINDRLIIFKEIGLMDKSRPWVATNIKTRMAIRVLLHNMMDKIKELKVAGWIDDNEYNKLVLCLKHRVSKAKRIKNVKPYTPELLIHELPWLGYEPKITRFLYQHAFTKVVNVGDVIVEEDQHAEGIYIVVTGILKLTYQPKKYILDKQKTLGLLPIIDYINSFHFGEKIEEYIVSGNCFGELSVITGRPYNCKIVVDSPSQLIFLKKDIILEAIKRSPDPINGLEGRMWKFLCIQLTVSLLLKVPVYRKLVSEEIKVTLQRAFVVNVEAFKKIVVDENIEDLVLIEGVASDEDTREVYVAPCYIPRTIKTIHLKKSSHLDLKSEVNARMLIIPIKDIDEYELMSRVQNISQTVDGFENVPLFLCHDHKKKQKGILHIGKRIEKITEKGVLLEQLPRQSITSLTATTQNNIVSSKSIMKHHEAPSVQVSEKGLPKRQSVGIADTDFPNLKKRRKSIMVDTLAQILAEQKAGSDGQAKMKSVSSTEGAEDNEVHDTTK